MTFSDLGLESGLLEAVRALGYTEPTPIQEQAIPLALAGRDIMGCAQTGTGKTAAFILPALQRMGRRRTIGTLVVTPTRELAGQIEDVARDCSRRTGQRVAAVYGGVGYAPQVNKLRRGVELLVATPGRLLDLQQHGDVDLSHVEILVLDEADRMLDMGFKPQVERLMKRLPRERQTMLFSATLDGAVGQLADSYTRDPSRFETAPLADHEEGNIDHRFVSVTADGKVERLVEELSGERGLALVFVRTKRGADRLAGKLARRHVDALALHGDMPQNARQRTLKRFRDGQVRTLVATDVAARGLDLEAITHVINFDPPEEDKDYVHRVGRTGRAGKSGNGITFVLPEQQADVSRLAARLGHREQFEREGMRVAPARRVYTSRRGRNSRW